MLENTINKENVNYLQEYFQNPFKVFTKIFLHVFDGCPDSRLNKMIREKFDTAAKKMKKYIETELNSLI